MRDGRGDSDAEQLVFGTSLTFRFNYRDSRNVKDVVLPLEFGEQLVTVLNKRRLCFRLSDQPLASTRLPALDRRRPGPKTPLIYLHGYEDVDTGSETIGSRLPPIAMTKQRITAAWQTAKATGYFDPGVSRTSPPVTTRRGGPASCRRSRTWMRRRWCGAGSGEVRAGIRK